MRKLLFIITVISVGMSQVFSLEKLFDDNNALKKRLEISSADKEKVLERDNKLREEIGVAKKSNKDCVDSFSN